MAGLVPAIHALLFLKTWMPGTRPGMTPERSRQWPGAMPGHSAVWRPARVNCVYTSFTFFSGRLRTGLPIAAWIASIYFSISWLWIDRIGGGGRDRQFEGYI